MTTKHKVLIVEDETKIAEVLRDYLESAGYAVSCLFQGNGVVSHVKDNPPELVLLDVMLPGKDGMEICREIRKFSNVPIIMITARVEEIDRLIGLELGADDYICKPFSPREVVARVKAVLRRVYSKQESKRLAAGPIVLDEETRQVTVDNEALNLTPSEFGLLQVMMAHPGRVYSRNELISKVQGYDFDGYDRTIDTHVKNLRKKIAYRLPEEEVISTVYGIGYKFTSPSG
jgi:two-component system response regulator BaeR